MSLDELREQVCAANTALVNSGLVTLSFGNVSGVDRAAGIMVIKPSGVPYQSLRPDDLVGVDLVSGAAVEGSARPSSDTPNPSPPVSALRRDRRHRPHPLDTRIGVGPGRAADPVSRDDPRGPLPWPRPGDTRLAPIRIGPDVRSRYRCRDHRDPGGARARPARDAGDPGSLPWAVHLRPGCGRCPCERHRPRGGGDDGGQTLMLDPDARPIGDSLLDRHFERKHGPGAYYGQAGRKS